MPKYPSLYRLLSLNIKRIVYSSAMPCTTIFTRLLTFVIPLTTASNDSLTKPNVVKSKSMSNMKPPGAECVCVPLIITLFSVYMSPNWVFNFRNTCGKNCNESHVIIIVFCDKFHDFIKNESS